ncbi:hypothetical protein BgiBS90_035840 [Biomphalaria glabrata]|nr:hypothetical protein BgiBS90_035840 [Biomphalaria glabrata]
MVVGIKLSNDNILLQPGLPCYTTPYLNKATSLKLGLLISPGLPHFIRDSLSKQGYLTILEGSLVHQGYLTLSGIPHPKLGYPTLNGGFLFHRGYLTFIEVLYSIKVTSL